MPEPGARRRTSCYVDNFGARRPDVARNGDVHPATASGGRAERDGDRRVHAGREATTWFAKLRRLGAAAAATSS